MPFTPLHTARPAATVAVLPFAVGLWRLPRPAWRQALVVALLSGVAVFLWRLSANKPDLNDDGLPGFSANDWAAPILTYITLGCYADLRAPGDPVRYRQVRALATIVALAVNVITI